MVHIDICNVDKIEELVQQFLPMCIVHCAAQRFPDKVDKDVEGTIKLNVEATKNLAILAGSLLNKLNIFKIYLELLINVYLIFK